MDRSIVYPSQQPTSNTWLGAEKAKMIAQAYLAQGVLGTNTIVDSFTCIPTVPASLAVTITPGSIYQLSSVDSTAYSSLPVDTVNQIIKQGILLQPGTNLTLTPPGVSGQAINYLIEASFLESDTGSAILSYFNSAQPTIPFTGPAGSGVSQPTLRQGLVSIVAKAGVAATAGSQVTPAPDAGYVGMFVVTVANGATQLTSSQISTYATAPFISVKLPGVPAWTQQGTYWWGVDTGTANAISTALTPTPTSVSAGMNLFVRKMNAANTGAMTITLTGAPSGSLGPYSVINADTTTLSNAEIAANFLMHLVFDGTSFRFMNGTTATAVGSLTASAGEGISVTGGATISLNYPGLTSEPVVNNVDLFSFYSIADAHHRVETWAQLIANIKASLQTSLVNVQAFTVPGNGTYVPTANTRAVLVFCTGGGGSAGCSGPYNNGYGGDAGGTAIAFANIVGVANVSYTIASGGASQTSTGLAGLSGGTSTFGTYAAATGGGGGWGPFSVLQGNNPGIGTVGLIKLRGNPGQSATGGNQPGMGGGSFWGGGGGAGLFSGTSYLLGTSGIYGGGGGSSFAPGGPSSPGLAGGSGLIVVFEFG